MKELTCHSFIGHIRRLRRSASSPTLSVQSANLHCKLRNSTHPREACTSRITESRPAACVDHSAANISARCSVGMPP
ncbi:hypothetical protein VTO73DRAFT_9761 [Trametes versicolor]